MGGLRLRCLTTRHTCAIDGLLCGPVYVNLLSAPRDGRRHSTEPGPARRAAAGRRDLGAATESAGSSSRCTGWRLRWAVDVRVGLEDNLWYDDARTDLATNPMLVERLVQIARAMGREPATPDQVRERLGIARPGRAPRLRERRRRRAMKTGARPGSSTWRIDRRWRRRVLGRRYRSATRRRRPSSRRTPSSGRSARPDRTACLGRCDRLTRPRLAGTRAHRPRRDRAVQRAAHVHPPARPQAAPRPGPRSRSRSSGDHRRHPYSTRLPAAGPPRLRRAGRRWHPGERSRVRAQFRPTVRSRCHPGLARGDRRRACRPVDRLPSAARTGDRRALYVAVASATIGGVISLGDFLAPGAPRIAGRLALRPNAYGYRLSGIIPSPNGSASLIIVPAAVLIAVAVLGRGRAWRSMAAPDGGASSSPSTSRTAVPHFWACSPAPSSSFMDAAGCRGAPVDRRDRRRGDRSPVLPPVPEPVRRRGRRGNGRRPRGERSAARRLARAASAMWLDEPLIGHGFQSYRELHAAYGDTVLSAPHNEWIRLFAEEGVIVGLAGIAWAVTTLVALARAPGWLGAASIAAFTGWCLAAIVQQPDRLHPGRSDRVHGRRYGPGAGSETDAELGRDRTSASKS